MSRLRSQDNQVTDLAQWAIVPRRRRISPRRFLSRRVLRASLGLLLAWGGLVSTDDGRTDLERQEPEALLVQVNKQVPLDPVDYEPPDLRRWRDSDYTVRSEVNEQLESLFAAAEDSGQGLRVISGYRSYDTQAQTYDYWASHYGQAAADASSARAGHSEHQTGLAVDVGSTTGECYLDPCFGQTSEGRWVAAHAHEFGFVLSYPKGARAQTGYTYEPWHLRYVGPRVATDMHQRGFRLLGAYLGASASSVRIGEVLGSRD